MPDHPADTADQPEDVATLRAALLAAEARIAALEQIIHSFKRARFGQSAERIDTAQLALTLGQDPPPPPANDPAAASAPTAPAAQSRQRNRGALPAHLERVEHVLDLADKGCPCCGRQMHRIGEDRTERLDVVPAQLRVRVTIRPRYACRSCTDGVHQRRAADHAIPGGLPTEALLAHVLMAKYGDGLPLYRQAAMLGRQGIALDRSTLCDWVTKACWWLRPMHTLILAHIMRQGRVFADYGLMRLMIAHGWAALCLRSLMSIPVIAGRNILACIWRLFAVCCRWMAMMGSRRCGATVMMAKSCWPFAGRICAGGFSTSTPRRNRRSPLRRCCVFQRSTPLRLAFVAVVPTGVLPCAKPKARRWWLSLRPGCTRS